MSKVCTEPGCPNLQPCGSHRREPWAGSTRKQNRHRSGSAERTLHRSVMREHHGICHVCGRPGADEVDHVIPIAERPDLAGDRTNLAPIHHAPCHVNKTAQEAARARRTRTQTTRSQA